MGTITRQDAHTNLFRWAGLWRNVRLRSSKRLDLTTYAQRTPTAKILSSRLGALLHLVNQQERTERPDRKQKTANDARETCLV